MSPLLKLVADLFQVTDAIVHWRLTVALCAGASVACVLWALIPDRVTGSTLWLVIVGVSTIIGLRWDKNAKKRTMV